MDDYTYFFDLFEFLCIEIEEVFLIILLSYPVDDSVLFFLLERYICRKKYRVIY